MKNTKIKFCQEFLKLSWGIRKTGILSMTHVNSKFEEINAVAEFLAVRSLLESKSDGVYEHITPFCNRVSEVMNEEKGEFPQWKRDIMQCMLPDLIAGNQANILLQKMKGYVSKQESSFLENWNQAVEEKLLQTDIGCDEDVIFQIIGLQTRVWDTKKGRYESDRPEIIKKIFDIYPINWVRTLWE